MCNIQSDPTAASSHATAISGHSTAFSTTLADITGGTAPSITEANTNGTSASRKMGRYTTVLPRSANEITTIAAQIQVVDDESATQFRTGG